MARSALPFPSVLDRALMIVSNRKASLAIALLLTAILIIDLLSSRQAILKFDDTLESVYFAMTVVIGYGIAPWFLISYVGKATTALQVRAPLIKLTHLAVTIIQASLLGVLLFVLFDRSTEYLTRYVFAVSYISAAAILGAFSFKFFLWYRSSPKKNLLVLLYALVVTTSFIAIIADAGSKLLLVQVTTEKSTPGAVPQETFPFKDIEQGQLIKQDIGHETTKSFIVPKDAQPAYLWLNLIPIGISFFSSWAATAITLRHYNRRMDKFTFWSLISLPLIFYFIGRAPDMFSVPTELWNRIIYRIGSIGGSILFGIVFLLLARKVPSSVNEYPIIAGIGFMIIGIAYSITPLQETFGVASHSLVLLASYLISVGLYSLATSISHDSKLRQSIRKSATEELNFLRTIGEAQMEQELQKKVMQVAKGRSDDMALQTGVQPSINEDDIKQYLHQVIEEIKSKKNSNNNSATIAS